MRTHTLVVTLAVALGCTMSACRGPSHPDQGREPALVGTPERTAAAAPDQRTSAASIERLDKLIAADRAAVATGERRVAELRELFRAFRISQAELHAAELDLLRSRQTLQLREWEREAAQRGVPNEPRPADLLAELVAGDRAIAAIEEQRVASVKSLVDAGRAGQTELLAAELELLRRRQTLQTREWELEDAQRRAARLPAGEPERRERR